MATQSQISRLESVPGEVFNNIIGHILDPCENELDSDVHGFCRYSFNTSILCTNRNIHSLARSYLHNGLAWVRIDVNWPSFLVDPRWVGVRYISITQTPRARNMSRHAGYDVNWQLHRQDHPNGFVYMNLRFPRPINEEQLRKIETCVTDNMPSNAEMRLLVLRRDLPEFLRIVRLNELVYNGATSSSTLSTPLEVLSYIMPGQERFTDEDVWSMLQVLERPRQWPCPTRNKASRDVSTVDAQWQLSYQSSTVRSTVWELIEHQIWLKFCGDQLMGRGLYFDAYLCYYTIISLGKDWPEVNDPSRPFLDADSIVFKAFRQSCMCNMVMAAIAGDMGNSDPHNVDMDLHVEVTLLLRAWGGAEPQNVFEWVLSLALYCILKDQPANGNLWDYLCEILVTWEDSFLPSPLPNDEHPYFGLYTWVYTWVSSNLVYHDPLHRNERWYEEEHKQCLQKLRSLMRVEGGFWLEPKPLGCLVDGRKIPVELRGRLDFASIDKSKPIDSSRGYTLTLDLPDVQTDDADGVDDKLYLF
jgi:hypothetical protein